MAKSIKLKNNNYIDSKGVSHNRTPLDTILTDVSNSITSLKTYSTNEVAIGTWIDGRTIYKRTFSGTYNNEYVLISNAELINAYGSVDSGTGIQRQMPYYEIWNNMSFYARVNIRNNNIVIDSYSSGSPHSLTGKFTLEYVYRT